MAIGNVGADAGALMGAVEAPIQDAAAQRQQDLSDWQEADRAAKAAGEPRPPLPASLQPKTGFDQAKQNLSFFGEELGDKVNVLAGNTERLNRSFNLATEEGDRLGFMGIDAFKQGTEGMAGLLQDPSSILDDPLIKAQLQQGIQASEAAAAAGGTQLGGGQLRELQALGQTFAGTQIDAQMGRFKDMAGLGIEGIDADTRRGTLQLAGQEQYANINLAGLGMEADLLSQRMTTEANLMAGQASAKANKRGGMMSMIGTVGGALIGGPVGAAIGAGLAESISE